jgi:hypothetical protein
MEVLEIKNSSAISKISFNDEENLVGISFTYNPGKEYLFVCDEIEDVKSQIKSTDSVGKLVNLFRKDGTFSQLNS